MAYNGTVKIDPNTSPKQLQEDGARFVKGFDRLRCLCEEITMAAEDYMEDDDED